MGFLWKDKYVTMTDNSPNLVYRFQYRVGFSNLESYSPTLRNLFLQCRFRLVGFQNLYFLNFSNGIFEYFRLLV